MQALCWNGINDLRVERVSDPAILNPRDAIVKIHLSSVCGSDLHLIDGLIPDVHQGDVLGHEFMGEVVETGSGVVNLKVGDRVVVSSVIGCGDCYHCQTGAWSLCDNSNPDEEALDQLFGYCTAGIFGFSRAFGGYAGSHAEFVRVPYADQVCLAVPEGVASESALFCSDAFPTGLMAADLCEIKPGDIVAVWGCGGVGQMAVHSAFLMGAERVIAIDRFPERLQMIRETSRAETRAETLDYMEVDVHEALKEMTGGRGPDSCIDAVGMEAYEPSLEYLYDKAKQMARLNSERSMALKQAIRSCRKGGVVSIVGVYSSVLDRFPMGAAMNKALRLHMGQQHGPKYIPRCLEHVQNGAVDPAYLLTHKFPLSAGPRAYEIFRKKQDGCVRSVFAPQISSENGGSYA